MWFPQNLLGGVLDQLCLTYTRPQKMTGDQTFDRFTVFKMSSQYMDHKFLDHKFFGTSNGQLVNEMNDVS